MRPMSLQTLATLKCFYEIKSKNLVSLTCEVFSFIFLSTQGPSQPAFSKRKRYSTLSNFTRYIRTKFTLILSNSEESSFSFGYDFNCDLVFVKSQIEAVGNGEECLLSIMMSNLQSSRIPLSVKQRRYRRTATCMQPILRQ